PALDKAPALDGRALSFHGLNWYTPRKYRMMESSMSSEPTPKPATKSSRRKRYAAYALVALLAWLVLAYLFVPALWKRYAHRHPAFEDMPGVPYTADGIPADPINVALVGDKAQVVKIMLAAKWYPADPLTLRSCLEMAEAAVFKRKYDDAPVSSEFL